ncbi:MAG: ABC transporter permease [Eubacterium sp.]|nr:ABC transporter permease [Eubacterium sp.]
MVKVDNKEVLRCLAGKFMQMNRGRNRIAVLSIMLTCLLFTSLFTGTESMILSKRAADIKKSMDTSHAIVQNLTEQEYTSAFAAVSENKAVRSCGNGIFLGLSVEERFVFSAEVRYADENMAQSFQQQPEYGHMPQKEDEIAVGTCVLDALDIPYKLGEEVTISYEQNPVTGKVRTDTFRLCGYWESDPAVLGQMVWVSDAYAQKYKYPVSEEDLKNGRYNGAHDLCVWYKSLYGISGKTQALTEESALTDPKRCFHANPAYRLFGEDGFAFGTVLAFAGFIILAGYLIIYNIFAVSVRTDMRVYGLLKNIGITGKQLKKMVHMQMYYLSAIGIPCGLFAGYLAGMWISPSLAADGEIHTEMGDAVQTVVSANPLLFLTAAVLTWITVYLSAMHSCRLVEQVTPVEALRMAQAAPLNKKQHPKRKKKPKQKAGRSVWFALAAWNVVFERKKGLVVMLSIALSLTVVNGIVMLVKGCDVHAYQEAYLAADFQIDQIPSSARNTSINRITPEIQKTLEACPYPCDIGYVHYSDEKHEMEPQLRTVWESIAQQNKEVWNDYENDRWKQASASGSIWVHFMGISQSVFEKLTWKEQASAGEASAKDACTWETFQSGAYILTDFNFAGAGGLVSYYKPGDTFSMCFRSGTEKTYTVLGEALLPPSLDYPYFDAAYITVMLPEEEFLACTQDAAAMYAVIDCPDKEREKIEQYLEDTVLKSNRYLSVESSLSMERSFLKYIDKYYKIGTVLVLILGLIGAMNLFNLTAASMLSRKKEFALLEAVGMTKTQCKRMLLAEGCMYLAGAVLLAVILTVTCGERILSGTVGKSFYFQVQPDILPCLALVPALFLIVYGIVSYQYGKFCRESVVERLREV